MEAVFRSGISSDFSGDFRLTSELFQWENGRKSPEKSADIPARNTASMIRLFPEAGMFDLGKFINLST
jgi:hypothetical protein